MKTKPLPLGEKGGRGANRKRKKERKKESYTLTKHTFPRAQTL